jgi:hypothetical protein
MPIVSPLLIPGPCLPPLIPYPGQHVFTFLYTSTRQDLTKLSLLPEASSSLWSTLLSLSSLTCQPNPFPVTGCQLWSASVCYLRVGTPREPASSKLVVYLPSTKNPAHRRYSVQVFLTCNSNSKTLWTAGGNVQSISGNSLVSPFLGDATAVEAPKPGGKKGSQYLFLVPWQS